MQVLCHYMYALYHSWELDYNYYESMVNQFIAMFNFKLQLSRVLERSLSLTAHCYSQ